MRLLKPMIIAAVLVLVVVLSGCAKKAAPAPAVPAEPEAAVPPVEEPGAVAPAPEVPEAPAAEVAAPARRPAGPGNVETVGEITSRKADYRWERKEGVSAISNINCELREDDSITLSFTVVNENGPAELGQQDPLAGVPGAQLSINGQRLKGNRVVDACGEDAVMLAEGETITCVVESVLRRNAIDGSQKTQSIEFEAIDYTTRHQFKCAE